VKVLVVDDEPLARRRLIRQLERIEGIEVAGEAADGIEARAKIRTLSPDLVLLDIAMPELDGLELAATTKDLPPIIFTTAHDHHAVRAFELAALDYLLKPIEQARLEKAIARAKARPPEDSTAIARLLEDLARVKREPNRVRVTARSGTSVRIFDPSAITRFHASDKYVVFQEGDEEFILDESLAALEARLQSLSFFRVHRSELVNLDHVRAVHQEDGETWVELSDRQRVQVSRRLVGDLKARLGLA
jgi:DNA-binding LytR/AlgR family response regulator